ncbi:MAG: hypothetical protein P1U87_15665 [Verrucomicrobiales bacterium]|nr:hypothetical protein [Verrucomicrobiales bacterium]
MDGTAPGRVTRIRFSEFVYRELDDEFYTMQGMPAVSKMADSDRAAK